MKIQLEYELKTRDFLQVGGGPGKNNDGLYGTTRAKTVEKNDLCIRDLGYFYLDDFEEMERRGVFYVSRLKLNIRVYKKFRTRLLIYKLTEEQTQKRLLIRAKQEKKKNITYKQRTKRLSAIIST